MVKNAAQYITNKSMWSRDRMYEIILQSLAQSLLDIKCSESLVRSYVYNVDGESFLSKLPDHIGNFRWCVKAAEQLLLAVTAAGLEYDMDTAMDQVLTYDEKDRNDELEKDTPAIIDFVRQYGTNGTVGPSLRAGDLVKKPRKTRVLVSTRSRECPDEDAIVREMFEQAKVITPGITEDTMRNVVRNSGLCQMSLDEARKYYIDILMVLKEG